MVGLHMFLGGLVSLWVVFGWFGWFLGGLGGFWLVWVVFGWFGWIRILETTYTTGGHA